MKSLIKLPENVPNELTIKKPLEEVETCNDFAIVATLLVKGAYITPQQFLELSTIMELYIMWFK